MKRRSLEVPEVSMNIYHYHITSQGDIIHENNSIIDESLIDMIYKNMEFNRTGRFPNAKYHLQFKDEELFLTVEDTPIVYKRLIDGVLYMTKQLSVTFNPQDLRCSSEGYLYHKSNIGEWGRLSTQVTMQLSESIHEWGRYYIYKDEKVERVLEPLVKKDEIFIHPKDDNHCFGCGKGNESGLRLTFVFNTKTHSTETWIRPPKVMMGSLNIMHGGMIALLCDEAMGKVLTGLGIKAPTGNLSIRYHKPTYMDQELYITASLISEQGRKLHLKSEIFDQNNVLTASATGLFIRIITHP